METTSMGAQVFRGVVALTLAAALDACGGGAGPAGQGDAAAGDGSQTADAAPVPRTITWDKSPRDLSLTQSGVYTFECTAPAMPNLCYGVDTYSDDSSICTAAVHAERITLFSGGAFTIQMRPGLMSYSGSNRGGIYTGDGAATPMSFVFLSARRTE